MRYFIVSDVHSFYTELMEGLNKAEFDINKDTLVVNGDLFDRGEESAKVLDFIQSIPKERRILIRGNHEYLLRDLVKKTEPQSHDWSNGTVFTMYQLYKSRHPDTDIFDEYEKYKNDEEEKKYFELNDWIELQKFNAFFYCNLYETWNKVCRDLLESELLDWIFGDEWVNYFELGDFIITHSFIATHHYIKFGTFWDSEYRKCNPEWRTNSTEKEWIDATWGCPYELFDDGYFDEEIKNNKTLICGHWHSEDFRWHYEGIKDNYNIYKRDNLIAIDGCTVVSHQVNVLIIDDDMNVYDGNNGIKL